MSYLSVGHTPDVGRHGLVVRRAIDFLLKVTPGDGYFGRVDGSRMYGQGITVLALAQSYGVEPDQQQRARILETVRRGVGVILKAQEVEKPHPHGGGWRYEPHATDSDLSLSAWNVLALRAATGIGIDVPSTSIDRAKAFVLECYRADGDAGGFAYQPRGETSAGMTAVGLLLLCALDSPQRPEVASAAKVLLRPGVFEQPRFPSYTTYYAVQAGFAVGEPIRTAVWAAARDRLLAQQDQDGGWPVSHSSEEPGRVYTTSMSVLTLSVPNHSVPAPK
jgi:hypothetical protein